jgi:YhcN/YlaJ family sporulation lipoprotein
VKILKKNKILFLVFVIALLVSAIGCTTKSQRQMGTQTRIGRDVPNNQIARRRNNNIMGIDRRNMDNLSGLGPNTTNNIVGPNTTTDITRRDNITDTNTMTDRANIIAQRVANLKEVNNCSVLLSGNTCIVGVDMKNNLQGKMTTALKQKIERTVRNTDNRIKNVSITADPDLFTRINNMATDMGNGRPITGFAKEFQEILRRITPVK